MSTATKSKKSTKPRKDVHAEITAAVLDLIATRGEIPWKSQYLARYGVPLSMATGKGYRGANFILLLMQSTIKGYTSPYWGTYKAITELGGQVRKDEHGSLVTKWKRFTVKPTEEEIAEGKEGKSFPVVFTFRVFNADQADGLPEKFHTVQRAPDFDPIAEAEAIAAGYVNGPSVTSERQDLAFYRPSADMVNVPRPENMATRSGYYSTLFHELGHSTGAAKRLNRAGITEMTPHKRGSLYAFEELVAEFTAAMLCGTAGIEDTLENSASYLTGWSKYLSGDPQAFLKAAAAAQKAADHILGTTDDEAVTEPPVLTEPEPVEADEVPLVVIPEAEVIKVVAAAEKVIAGMSVTMDTDDLFAALKAVKPAINRYSGRSVPALTGVHLVPGDGNVTLIGTDLDLTITRLVKATVINPSESLVSAKHLLDLLPTAKKDRTGIPIELQVADGIFTATNGHVSTLPAMLVEDYPKVSTTASGKSFALDLVAVASVLPATSNEETRPILTGVLFEESRLVACDSYRLHIVDTKMKFKGKALVPGRILAETLKRKCAATIVISTDRVTITCADGVVLSSRLIEGEFPNYRQLIPTTYTESVTFDNAKMLSCLDELKRMKPSDTTPVRMSNFDGDLQLRVIETDRFDAVRLVPGQTPIDNMGFNPKYLRELLEGGFDHLQVLDSLKPAVTTLTDQAGRLHTRLIMPVRIK